MAKTVAVAEFEAHSRELLREVTATNEEVVVTMDGKPVAKLVPAASLGERRRRSLEQLRGSVTILGDIVEPLDEEWDVMK